MTTVINMTALRGITGTPDPYIQLLGYYAANDGGGGFFYWNGSSTLSDNTGTIIQPTSITGAGRWLRLYSGSLNVNWFDSAGNTDPAVAINTAIGVANLTAGEVYIPTGVYVAKTKIILQSNVRLRGDGYSSQLIKDFASGAIQDALITAEEVEQFEICDLKLVGNSLDSEDCPCLVWINYCQYCKIYNCDISHSFLGIVVWGYDTFEGEVKKSNHIEIFRNRLYDTGLNAIGINNLGSNMSVTDNEISDYGKRATLSVISAAIELRGSKKTIIARNIIGESLNSWDPITKTYVIVSGVNDGIRLEPVVENLDAELSIEQRQDSEVIVSENIITNVSGYGIRVQYDFNCIFTNNVIRHALASGIIVTSSQATINSEVVDLESKYNIVAHNLITRDNDDANGIIMAGYSTSKVRMNVIADNSIHKGYLGISVSEAEDNLIKPGICTQLTGYGIHHQTGKRNSFMGGKSMYNFLGLFVESASSGDSEDVLIADVDTYENTLSIYSKGILIDANALNTIINGACAYSNTFANITNYSASTLGFVSVKGTSGYFALVPIPQPTLPTSPTVADVVSALTSVGIVQ